MKTTILSLSLLLILQCAISQESLRIGDVRTSWSTQEGSIDSMLINITPKGLYAECKVTLDFSARGTTFQPGDSLEVQLYFKLPEKAEVTDMYLWIEDTIMRAQMLDIWTASQIYESIVKRRKDPAILTKNYNTDSYSLRIFPMDVNMPRKVQFTYLVPIKNIENNPSIQLPYNFITISKNPIQKIIIRYSPDNILDNPVLRELESAHFNKKGTNIVYYETIIESSKSLNSLTLELDNKNENPYYFAKTNYTINNDSSNYGYYQLQVNPAKLFNINTCKKGLFLIDYTNYNNSYSQYYYQYYTNYNYTQILQNLQNSILTSFGETDSFNIMVSDNKTPYQLGNHWLPAKKSVIDSVFKILTHLDSNSIKTNTDTLLLNAVDFIKQNGNLGSIIVVSNSYDIKSIDEGNKLLKKLDEKMMENLIPFYIINLNYYYYYYYWDYYYDYQNNYYARSYTNSFYTNLSRKTSGDIAYQYTNDLSTHLNTAITKISEHFKSFELYTYLDDGMTFSNYTINKNELYTYLDQPIGVTGKYTGTGNFYIMAKAQLPSGKFYRKLITINGDDALILDTVSSCVWAAQYIKDLESQSSSNYNINQIIEVSKNERVLSSYTSLLALEPNYVIPDVIEENNNNNNNVFFNDVLITSVDDNVKANANIKENKLSNYPNPFNSATTIKYSISEKSTVRIEVFNSFGQSVSVVVDEEIAEGEYTINFDASNLSAGIYYCKMIVNGKETKLLKMVKTQ